MQPCDRILHQKATHKDVFGSTIAALSPQEEGGLQECENIEAHQMFHLWPSVFARTCVHWTRAPAFPRKDAIFCTCGQLDPPVNAIPPLSNTWCSHPMAALGQMLLRTACSPILPVVSVTTRAASRSVTVSL